MVLEGTYCIDRYEVSAVDRKTRAPLSPYYPPEQKLLRFVYSYWRSESRFVGDARARAFPIPEVPLVEQGDFEPVAVSSRGALPQGYFTYYSAKLACENAGKRLCTEDEWVHACRGAKDTKHPYGETFEPGKCNVFRATHPALALHGNSSVGHLDPRLHLVLEEGKWPLLEKTGARETCASRTAKDVAYDMEGNLDEWIEDPNGTFVGGFYSRSTREGCAAKVENHAPGYTDYSLGTRCCLSR
jgi:formylglycine-generating enzyme